MRKFNIADRPVVVDDEEVGTAKILAIQNLKYTVAYPEIAINCYLLDEDGIKLREKEIIMPVDAGITDAQILAAITLGLSVVIGAMIEFD